MRKFILALLAITLSVISFCPHWFISGVSNAASQNKSSWKVTFEEAGAEKLSILIGGKLWNRSGSNSASVTWNKEKEGSITLDLPVELANTSALNITVIPEPLDSRFSITVINDEVKDKVKLSGNGLSKYNLFGGINPETKGFAFNKRKNKLREQQTPETQEKFKPRGIFGWKELRDYVTVEGEVIGFDYSLEDGDWLLYIVPIPGYKHLLVNSDGKQDQSPNNRGVIECEVEPIDEIEDGYGAYYLFSRLQNRRITMVGTWVEDISHDNKTEIHPITSIQGYGREETGDFLHVFVISDESFNFPARVPHSKENRVGFFNFPLQDDTDFKIEEEIDYSRPGTKKFEKRYSPSYGNYFWGTVESGSPNDAPKKGFYYAKIRVNI